MSYVDPRQFVTKMVDAGVVAAMMSTSVSGKVITMWMPTDPADFTVPAQVSA